VYICEDGYVKGYGVEQLEFHSTGSADHYFAFDLMKILMHL
jgi:hypothetical protein